MSKGNWDLWVRRHAHCVLMWTRDFVLWKATGGSPPHFIKERLVQRFQEQYALSVLVETGTYLGYMLEAVKKDFREIYSIELDEALFQHAKEQFKNCSHIHIIQGDSGELLPDILKEIDSPALFWLDSHFSGGITAKGKIDTPILKELSAIKERYISGHVIMIDDASNFTGEGGYPTCEHIIEFIRSMDSGISIEIINDSICAHNPNLRITGQV